ncbi:superinfection immunity protein [Glaciimonas sp. CA11.2]|uniref:superinfection immunity protein n=1 Tax=Glaciimonas sp. CA11.2 TaxID=3048601 RepID=UPI002AB35077|nr:superinfection immunity protein [Glaciimonas sp. CA11.2]MDY7549178.1 superinfection immunity protein [Glaciimonas sp. CA11.2]MEB0161499.1 superinfection immunity protein [Glaciimonas sp. CA11.2]
MTKNVLHKIALKSGIHKFTIAVFLSSAMQLAYADDGSNAGGFVLLLLLFAFGVWVYFLPSIKATNLKHPDQKSIFVLNLLLGWLLIPWVIALVWAYKKSTSVIVNPGAPDAAVKAKHIGDTENNQSLSGLKNCPFCAEDIKLEAIRCKHCQADLTLLPPYI